MNVYNISVVEKAAIELYSNLYPLQENGIQHEFYNGGREKAHSFITKYLQQTFTKCLRGTRHVRGPRDATGISRDIVSVLPFRVYRERWTIREHCNTCTYTNKKTGFRVHLGWGEGFSTGSACWT